MTPSRRWDIAGERPGHQLFYAGRVIEVSPETAVELRRLIETDVVEGRTVVLSFKQQSASGVVTENTVVLGPGIAAHVQQPLDEA